MNAIWKDILWPGRWTFRDGRKLKVGSAEIRNAFAQGQAIKAAKLDVPYCWEHQPDAEPHSVEMSSTVYGDANKRAIWAKNCIAPVVDYRIRTDPERGEILEAAFDASKLSEKELSQVKNCGKVSCLLNRDFRDARTGKVFAGLSVSHIAVTPKPIEPNQGGFQMSQHAKESFYMGDAVPEKKPDEEEGIVDLERAPEEKPPEEKPPETEEKTVDPASLSALIVALRESGIMVPDEVTDVPGLIIAIKAGAFKPATPDPLSTTSDSTDTTSAASAAPLMMSQAAMEKTRPEIVKADRKSLQREINELVKTGRIAPPIGAALHKQHGSFQLSYADGEIAEVGLVAKIRAYQALPAGTVMKPKADGTYEMSTAMHQPPESLDNKAEVDRANAIEADIVARTAKFAGIQPKK